MKFKSECSHFNRYFDTEQNVACIQLGRCLRLEWAPYYVNIRMVINCCIGMSISDPMYFASNGYCKCWNAVLCLRHTGYSDKIHKFGIDQEKMYIILVQKITS